MNKSEFLTAWEQFLLANYDKIISGEIPSISFVDVQNFHQKNQEEMAEQRFWQVYDAEGHEPLSKKEFIVNTKEFGEITVDEETYYKYYEKLLEL